MEKHLFNLYLKHIKDTYGSTKKITKLPKKLIVLLFAIMCTFVAAIVCLAIMKGQAGNLLTIFAIASVLLIVISLVLCFVLFSATEKHEIQTSAQTMKEYWEYCYSIRDWFEKTFVVEKASKENIDENIQEVKARLDSYLDTQLESANKRNDRIDKWIQALAIPFVLALITGVLEYNSDMIEAVSTIFSIVVIFAYIIGGIWIVWNIKKLFNKHKIEQLKYFSEDLQGALDSVKYYNKPKKINLKINREAKSDEV